MDFENFYEEQEALYGHLLVENISYWNREEESIESVHLKLVGRCIEYANKHNSVEKKRVMFVSDQIMSVRPDKEYKTDPIVTINEDRDLMFIMPKEKYELIKQYYQKINDDLQTKQEDELIAYKERSNFLLAKLFEHIDELAEITINFIENQKVGLLTDFNKVMLFNRLVLELDQTRHERLLLVSSDSLNSYFNQNSEEIQFHVNEVEAFFNNEFRHFISLLREYEADVDAFTAYMFLMNIAMQFYANKWAEGFETSFNDIDQIDVQSAMERFCSLDNINALDLDTQGRFFYYLFKNNKLNQEINIFDNIETFQGLIKRELENKNYKNFKNRLLSKKNETTYSIDDIDLMDGQEFEKFLALLFSKTGYRTELTKASGDQGIDIIAEKNGKKIGIQAKCYTNTVGNSAIQEAVSGKAFYTLDKVMVVTNSTFSESAIKLAQANSVVLWDRNLLKEKIAEIFS